MCMMTRVEASLSGDNWLSSLSIFSLLFLGKEGTREGRADIHGRSSADDGRERKHTPLEKRSPLVVPFSLFLPSLSTRAKGRMGSHKRQARAVGHERGSKRGAEQERSTVGGGG